MKRFGDALFSLVEARKTAGDVDRLQRIADGTGEPELPSATERRRLDALAGRFGHGHTASPPSKFSAYPAAYGAIAFIVSVAYFFLAVLMPPSSRPGVEVPSITAFARMMGYNVVIGMSFGAVHGALELLIRFVSGKFPQRKSAALRDDSASGGDGGGWEGWGSDDGDGGDGGGGD